LWLNDTSYTAKVSEGPIITYMPARNTLVQLFALYTKSPTMRARMRHVTDRQTDRQTDRRQDYANRPI